MDSNNEIWEDGCFHLFLSHKSKYKKTASGIKKGLSIYGISCFVAHEDIRPTKKWQDKIEEALFTMDALVALITENFHGSFWTDQEVGIAIGRNIPIIPVNLEENPRGFIANIQALKYSKDDFDLNIVKLLLEKCEEKMKYAYIQALKSCRDYNEANRLAEILPFIRSLTDNQVSSIIEAYRDNSQVKDSFGFNGEYPSKYGLGLAFYLQKITGKDCLK